MNTKIPGLRREENDILLKCKCRWWDLNPHFHIRLSLLIGKYNLETGSQTQKKRTQTLELLILAWHRWPRLSRNEVPKRKTANYLSRI
jgi:hypothetical protein